MVRGRAKHQTDQDLIETLKVRRVTRVALRPTRWQNRATRYVALALVLMVAFSLLSINVRQPWVSVHEDNGLVFMSAAINNIRFGLSLYQG